MLPEVRLERPRQCSQLAMEVGECFRRLLEHKDGETEQRKWLLQRVLRWRCGGFLKHWQNERPFASQ